MITTLLAEIASRYGLRRGTDRWFGPCPKCGGSKTSDKFRIKDDGGFKCFACGWGGDIITWLREIDGRTCAEAHDLAGQECRAQGCQHRGTCRHGDGSGRKATRPARASVAPRQSAAARPLPSVAARTPAELWSSWAEQLVATAAKTLANCPDVLAWLAAARGLDAAAVARFRLGWLGHDRKIDRAAIGLPPKDGKPTLWVPGGLVLPIHDHSGNLIRLRIRRTDAARAKFLADLKYVWLEGSGTAPLFIAATGRRRGAVVVEAELDAMAIAAAHPDVDAIAIGTVSGGLTAPQQAELAKAPAILIALDAETRADGKPGPGPEQVRKWLGQYRQARYWPVPSGKDPGDYVAAGGNLRAWIEAGLVPPVANPAPRHDLALSAGSSPPGGEGGEDIQQVEEAAPGPKHYILPLPDGREIHVTDDETLWRGLIDDGKIAFSENELLRLRTATAGLPDDERLAAAMAAVDVKEEFSGAYIRRGEVTA